MLPMKKATGREHSDRDSGTHVVRDANRSNVADDDRGGEAGHEDADEESHDGSGHEETLADSRKSGARLVDLESLGTEGVADDAEQQKRLCHFVILCKFVADNTGRGASVVGVRR